MISIRLFHACGLFLCKQFLALDTFCLVDLFVTLKKLSNEKKEKISTRESPHR